MPNPKRLSKAQFSYLRENYEEELWCNVTRGEEDDCWPCTLKTNNRDYAQMPMKTSPDSKWVRRLCHRFALELKLGRPLRKGYYALHTCDFKICCNPAHLYEGTLQDNADDYWSRSGKTKIELRRLERKTLPECETTSKKTLSVSTIKEVYSLYHSNIHPMAIASLYSIGKSTVERIGKGYLYRNVTGHFVKQVKPGWYSSHCSSRS